MLNSTKLPNNLFKLRPEDDEPSVCRKCVNKQIVKLPEKIAEDQRILAFLKEQVEENEKLLKEQAEEEP